MLRRINPYLLDNKALDGLASLGKHLKNSSCDQGLLELVALRVSQINGCAFCLDMHSKALLNQGVSENKIFVLSAWRDTSLYSSEERAALLWAEALTQIGGNGVSEKVYSEVSEYFSETEIVDLTMVIVAINGYNRINIGFGIGVGESSL